MAYTIGKPAHNRLTNDQIRKECEKRNHEFLSFDHPIISVKCFCGNIYSQKIHSYKAAKNSCRECDSKRKSVKRPQHSVAMRGENNPSKRPEVRKLISLANQGSGGSGLYSGRELFLDTLYLVTVADVTGKIHYKIGRSFHGPHKRLQRSLVTVIKEWEGPHWLVWTTEQSLLAQNSGSRSCPTPTLDSTGGTECFGEGLPITSVISYCNFIFGTVDSW